jgi:hypothetical protein
MHEGAHYQFLGRGGSSKGELGDEDRSTICYESSIVITVTSYELSYVSSRKPRISIFVQDEAAIDRRQEAIDLVKRGLMMDMRSVS